jgi:hypothetical protein
LRTFDAAVDCVVANNRLKAAGNSEKGRIRLAPELAATSEPGIFPDAKRRTIREEKCSVTAQAPRDRWQKQIW